MEDIRGQMEADSLLIFVPNHFDPSVDMLGRRYTARTPPDGGCCASLFRLASVTFLSTFLYNQLLFPLSHSHFVLQMDINNLFLLFFSINRLQQRLKLHSTQQETFGQFIHVSYLFCSLICQKEAAKLPLNTSLKIIDAVDLFWRLVSFPISELILQFTGACSRILLTLYTPARKTKYKWRFKVKFKYPFTPK